MPNLLTATEAADRRAATARENGKKGGRPKALTPTEYYAARLPIEQVSWLKANGGAKKLRQIIAEGMLVAAIPDGEGGGELAAARGEEEAA